MAIKKIVLGIMLCSFYAFTSCDTTNIFEPQASKDSDKYLLEEAKIEIDQKEYTKALALIEQMKGDSNDKRVTWTSAVLGDAGLGLFDIQKAVTSGLEEKSPSSGTTSSGSDDFFNDIDDSLVFGEGEIREKRIAAIKLALEIMSGSPELSEGIQNLNCVFAALLALPTVKNGKTAIAEATTNLESILSKVEGAGTSKEQCPGIDSFEENLTVISDVSNNLKTVLATVNACPILNLEEGSLNAIEGTLNTLYEKADLGCKSIECTGIFCEALKLSCISTLIDSGETAVAQDGVIATCELVQNCLSGDCF